MMVLPGDEIDPVTGVIGMLGRRGFPGLMEVCRHRAGPASSFVALMTYQVAYSRLIFVSGLERHLPRIFTHLNPRTRNPVTAILIQGVISSLILVGAVLAEQHGQRRPIFLQGGLSTVWLISGFFFLFPVIIARKKYADRYANETVLADSRRHGRRLDHRHRRHDRHDRRHLLLVRQAVDRVVAGDGDLDDVGRQHRLGMVALGVVVYFFGRRSAAQDIAGRRAGPSGGARSEERRCHDMTMESTGRSDGRPVTAHPYPLDPLTGAEIEAAAAIITDSEYCTPTAEIRDDPAGGAGQDARPDVRGGDGRAEAGVRHHVRRRGRS